MLLINLSKLPQSNPSQSRNYWKVDFTAGSHKTHIFISRCFFWGTLKGTSVRNGHLSQFSLLLFAIHAINFPGYVFFPGYDVPGHFVVRSRAQQLFSFPRSSRRNMDIRCWLSCSTPLLCREIELEGEKRGELESVR
ncbi:hypothetical protein NPIL_187211 [Nephila pilipes]|uniref:Uncharacterized protein n=1 Tax=Nephila pilipes TaxID=299642 RepID=A0A8X6TYG3_NEPPI|nr:hypothetical protein NPIL_187211 [Nephila pilipes]